MRIYKYSMGFRTPAVDQSYSSIYYNHDLRAVFVELIQSCRTDTDPIYCSVSDPLPKSSVAFLDTDLDQIGSSSVQNVGFCCVSGVCKACAPPPQPLHAEMTSKVYELDLRGQKIERIENLEQVCFMLQCKYCT